MILTTTKKAIPTGSIAAVYAACGDNDILRGMMICGCEIGLRYGDIVALKVRDVVGIPALSKFQIVEQKTNANFKIEDGVMVRKGRDTYRDCIMSSAFRRVCDVLIAGRDLDEFLFAKKKGGIPMSRQNYAVLIKKACIEAGLDADTVEAISSHSCRKSFGVALREAGNSMEAISEMYGHSSIVITRRYCGFDAQDKAKMIGACFG